MSSLFLLLYYGEIRNATLPNKFLELLQMPLDLTSSSSSEDEKKQNKKERERRKLERKYEIVRMSFTYKLGHKYLGFEDKCRCARA